MFVFFFKIGKNKLFRENSSRTTNKEMKQNIRNVKISLPPRDSIKNKIQTLIDKIIFDVLTDQRIRYGLNHSFFIPIHFKAEKLSDLIENGVQLILDEFNRFCDLLSTLKPSEKQIISRKYFNAWLYYYYEHIQPFQKLLAKAIPILSSLCDGNNKSDSPIMMDYSSQLLSIWKSYFSHKFSENIKIHEIEHARCRDCYILKEECIYHCLTCEAREKGIYGTAYVCKLCYLLRAGSHMKNHYDTIQLIAK